MTPVIEIEVPTEPARRQAQETQSIIAQKVNRLRAMQAFFKSLPDRRAEAGLAPIPDNIREMAYEEREAAQL